MKVLEQEPTEVNEGDLAVLLEQELNEVNEGTRTGTNRSE